MRACCHVCFLLLLLAGLAAGEAAGLRPLHCKDGVLRYPDGSEVALWGVNFQTPLHWEYRYESRPAGVAPDADAINRMADANLDSVQAIGAQVLRVHLNPSDLADGEGGLRASPYLDALDHLLRRCRERGLYVYLTLINDMGTPYFPDSFMAGIRREAWLFNPDFLTRAERFITALLAHANRYDGTVLAADPALAVIELVNEPAYPTREALRTKPALAAEAARYDTWLAARPAGDRESSAVFASYRQERVAIAIARLLAAVRAGGARQPVVWNLNWPGMINDHADAFQAVADSAVDGVSACLYPGNQDVPYYEYWKNPRDLTGKDYFPFVQQAVAVPSNLGWMRDPRFSGKVKLVYEFETMYNQSAHIYPAMAAAFRSLGIQIATQWHYRLLPAAQWQGGSHYLNLECTPRKALGFAVAGQVFRSTGRGAPFLLSDQQPSQASGPGWSAAVAGDVAWWAADGVLFHAGDLPPGLVLPAGIHRILGIGASPLAAYAGSGSYSIDVAAEAVTMVIRPDARITRPVWRTGHQAGDEPMCALEDGVEHALDLRLPGWDAGVLLERIAGEVVVPVPMTGVLRTGMHRDLI